MYRVMGCPVMGYLHTLFLFLTELYPEVGWLNIAVNHVTVSRLCFGACQLCRCQLLAHYILGLLPALWLK